MLKYDPILHSIDKKHSQMMEEFYNDEIDIIPQLVGEKNQLKIKIRELSSDRIDEFVDMKDQIENIKSKIKELRLKKKRYLLNNSQHIFNYFEEKKKISTGESNNVNVLNSFFKLKTVEVDPTDKNSSSKQSIINYWKNVNNEITNIGDFVIPTDICASCHKGELIPQDEEGVMICNNRDCGKFVTFIVDSSKPSNKEPPNEVSYTAYIRLNHFKEILSQFQAKETTQIPEHVIDDIRLRIKKERISNLAEEINYDKMREILRKLGYNKYYEHINFIKDKLGIKPPIITQELEETLCNFFMEIQYPYAKHCPDYRVNFLHYYYVLYKLFELLGEKHYLPEIPMLKDREKLIEQDTIWKKICEELDWEFITTI